MSMTREEAIKHAESKKVMLEALIYNDDCKYGNYAMYSTELSFVNAALAALRPVSREQLSEFKTCELVDELRKREGVETHIAGPYQDVTVSVNGPAVVLVVID